MVRQRVNTTVVLIVCALSYGDGEFRALCFESRRRRLFLSLYYSPPRSRFPLLRRLCPILTSSGYRVVRSNVGESQAPRTTESSVAQYGRSDSSFAAKDRGADESVERCV